MNPLLRLHLLVFPPACHDCGQIMNPLGKPHRAFPYLCEPCREALPWKDPSQSCQRCGVLTAEPDRKRCPNCAHRSFDLDRIWCAFHYSGSPRQWILSLKYYRNESLARMLGNLLSQSQNGDQPLAGADIVIPVPLHRKRLRKRGFNQSYLLAHAWLAEETKLGREAPPINTELLVRHRHTRPQVEVDAKERESNVAEAFSISPGRKGGTAPDTAVDDNTHPLKGKNVLLVDDLITTGATLNACAKTLLSAGAARVEALVLARA